MYPSPDAAVADAVAQLREAQRRRERDEAWLRAEIQKGLDDVEAGRVHEIGSAEELHRVVMTHGRRLAEKRREAKV